MPRSLRQHVAEAERIWSIGGVRTLIPKKDPPAPVKVAVYNEQLVYAISVRTVVAKFDRTGWAQAYLYASDDVCAEVWRQIPDVLVCPYCLTRVCGDAVLPGRVVLCRPCGDYVRPKKLRGLVSADLSAMAKRLRNGEIPVRGER